MTRWFGDVFREQHKDVVQHCIDVFLANDLSAYAETCRMTPLEVPDRITDELKRLIASATA